MKKDIYLLTVYTQKCLSVEQPDAALKADCGACRPGWESPGRVGDPENGVKGENYFRNTDNSIKFRFLILASTPCKAA